MDGGISASDIELEFDKFIRKSNENYKHDHPFTAADIKDLPKAIAEPVAVFNGHKESEHVILTELKKDGKNFIVVVRATERNRRGGNIIEVNEITTLFPKDAIGLLNWILKDKGTQYDKKKTLAWLEESRTNLGPEQDMQELYLAAKKVKEFDNSKRSSEIQNDSKEEVRYSRVADHVPAWGSYSPLQGRSGRMTLEDFEEYAEKAKSGILVLSRTKAAEIRAMLGLPERNTKAGAKAGEVKRIAQMDEKERKAAVKAMTRFLKAAMTGLRRDFKIGEVTLSDLMKSMKAMGDATAAPTAEAVTSMAEKVYGICQGLVVRGQQAARDNMSRRKTKGWNIASMGYHKVMREYTDPKHHTRKGWAKTMDELQERADRNDSNKREIERVMVDMVQSGEQTATVHLLGTGLNGEEVTSEQTLSLVEMQAQLARIEAEQKAIVNVYKWAEANAKLHQQRSANKTPEEKIELREEAMELRQTVLDDWANDINDMNAAAPDWMEDESTTREKLVDMTIADTDMERYRLQEDERWGIIHRAIDDAHNATKFSLDFCLRVMGATAHMGEGRLHKHFYSLYSEARNREIERKERFHDEIENKSKELTGKSVGRLNKELRKDSEMEITEKESDGSQGKKRTLTKGQVALLYEWSKQDRFEEKIEKTMDLSAYTDQQSGDVDYERLKADIAAEVAKTKGLKEYCDYLRDFLKARYGEYSATFAKRHGNMMPENKEYFPFRSVKGASAALGETPVRGVGVSAGAENERTSYGAFDLNNSLLDIFKDHMTEMEKVECYWKLSRDLNIMVTEPAIVGRMRAIHPRFLERFRDAANLTVGSLERKRNGFADTIIKINKRSGRAAITWRLWTAFKQTESILTYLGHGPKVFGMAANPMNWRKAWEWGITNLPMLRERIKTASMGDEMIDLSRETRFWSDKTMVTRAMNDIAEAIDWIGRKGMKPNQWIDAMACAAGAWAIYDTTKAHYVKNGMSEEEAEKMAKMQAEIGYNTTQQSQESFFLSPAQSNTMNMALGATMFKNSPFSWGRLNAIWRRGLTKDWDKMRETLMDVYDGNEKLVDAEIRWRKRKSVYLPISQVIATAVWNSMTWFALEAARAWDGDDDELEKEDRLRDLKSIGVMTVFQLLFNNSLLQNAILDAAQIYDLGGALSWWYEPKGMEHSLTTVAETMTPTTFLANIAGAGKRIDKTFDSKDLSLMTYCAIDAIGTTNGVDVDVLTDATAGIVSFVEVCMEDGMSKADAMKMLFDMTSVPKTARREIVEALRTTPVLNPDGSEKIDWMTGKPVMMIEKDGYLKLMERIMNDQAISDRTVKIFPEMARRRTGDVLSREATNYLTRNLGTERIALVDDERIQSVYQRLQSGMGGGLKGLLPIMDAYRMAWESKKGIMPKVVIDAGGGIIPDGNEWKWDDFLVPVGRHFDFDNVKAKDRFDFE